MALLNLIAAATQANLRPPKAKAILREVHAAVADWEKYAAAAAIFRPAMEEIRAHLRLGLPA